MISQSLGQTVTPYFFKKINVQKTLVFPLVGTWKHIYQTFISDLKGCSIEKQTRSL